jgi:hypothetical protein
MTPGRLWTGRVLSAIVVLFFVMDSIMKIIRTPASIDATTRILGYPDSAVVGIGVTLLICTILYVIPRTSLLGAILVTGYLGGAVASNIRIGSPAFNTLFPIVCAAFVWAGLWLREPRLQQLFPLRGSTLT